MLKIEYEGGAFRATRQNPFGAYRLESEIRLKDGVALSLIVPAGFIFNISRPGRLARLLVRDDDPKLLPAAAVHDYLVVHRGWPRLMALGPFLHVYLSRRPNRLRFALVALGLLARSIRIDRQRRAG